MAPKIRLDRAGMAAMLKSSGVALEVEIAAEDVASRIHEDTHDGPAPVEVTTGTTDRAVARVTITHAAGLALEAKYGALTRAAQGAGLEVTAQ